MASPLPRPSGSGTGLPRGVEAGPLGKRLVAHLIDNSVPALVAAALAVMATRRVPVFNPSLAVGVVIVLAWLVLVWRMFALRAAGPGMRLMKLQLVGLSDGRPIGWGRFFVRFLVLLALRATVLGLLLMLVFLVRQRRRQGWHDLVANSVVIKRRMLAPKTGQSAVGASTSSTPPAQVEAVSVARSISSEGVGVAPNPTSGPAATEGRQSVSTLTPNAPKQPVESDSAPQWVAVFDDGRQVPITGDLLVGRNPIAGPGEEDAQLVRVPDSSRTVSKLHLSLGVDDRGAYVVDRASTNGSTITDAQGNSTVCAPGEVVPIEEGALVSFGDHWLRIHRG